MSAAASATNQNAWIGYMKQELKKYPKMKLVSTVYGNDDPTTATQVTQGLLQQYPNLKGIISPTTVGILAAAAVLDTPKYRGKIALTGLGTPDSLKKYVADGTIQAFELWNPDDLGYLAGVRGGRARVGEDQRRAGPVVHRGQARQVHGRRGQHRPARPAVRLQQRQHQPVQLLTAVAAAVHACRVPAAADRPDAGHRHRPDPGPRGTGKTGSTLTDRIVQRPGDERECLT